MQKATYMINNNTIAFLFDLDGVLIDSESEYTKIWDRINLKYPTGVEQFSRKIKGTTLTDILSTYFQEDLHPDIIADLYKFENQMVFRYCPGAREFLLYLKEHGIPSAIVTSSNMAKMDKLRRQIPDIGSLVDKVISSEDVEKSKPDPEGYLKAAHALGMNPADCVVVEDSLSGCKAGKNAGATVIGIAATVGTETLRKHADFLFETFSDMKAAEIIRTISDSKLK